MQFIDLKSQYESLKDKIDARIQGVLDKGAYIMGPEVAEFESKLSEFVGVKHAISCANGTDALQLALMALGVKAGDAVFCPTFTFFATAEAIAFVGATPIFVDSDDRTFNISIVDLESKISEVQSKGILNPKAIIAVDLFGLPADYEKLEPLSKKHGLLLIEDAAQGLGGEILGRKAGSFGDIATTSFFPAKPLGCYGDGGALFTNDDNIAALLRSLQVHGKGNDKYDNVRIGMNSRLDTLQAAILLEKLSVFPEELKQRNQIAAIYSDSLNVRYRKPLVPDGYMSSWAQYTLQHESRDSCMAKLKSEGIPSAIYYGKCMHMQGAFSNLGYMKGDFPIAEKLSSEVFSLPMSPYLSDADGNFVIQTLNDE